MSDVTRLLNAIEDGDLHAADQLLPVVYHELRRLARSRMKHERGEHTLQPTALVHEAYLRLVGGGTVQWDGRGHFFAAAAEAMRRILIDYARQKRALKHGGDRKRVDLEDTAPSAATDRSDPNELLALDDALARLAKEHPDKAELVKLLYFGGLNLEQAAAVMGTSRTSAHRQWVFARAWLRDAMQR